MTGLRSFVPSCENAKAERPKEPPSDDDVNCPLSLVRERERESGVPFLS